MIELFSRKTELFDLPEEAVFSPLPINDELASVSAIIVDEDYYNFLMKGSLYINGIRVLEAGYLIPFKMKAWLDLSEKRQTGSQIQGEDIKKHKMMFLDSLNYL